LLWADNENKKRISKEIFEVRKNGVKKILGFEKMAEF